MSADSTFEGHVLLIVAKEPAKGAVLENVRVQQLGERHFLVGQLADYGEETPTAHGHDVLVCGRRCVHAHGVYGPANGTCRTRNSGRSEKVVLALAKKAVTGNWQALTWNGAAS